MSAIPKSEAPYQAIHGQRFKGKLMEFGKKVFYYVPKKLRSKLNLRWRVGTFVGNAQSTNEAFVAIANGDVIKTRSLVRVVLPSRWSKADVFNVRGVPHRLRVADSVQDDSFIEELVDPHANADRPEVPATPRSSKESISKEDVQ